MSDLKKIATPKHLWKGSSLSIENDYFAIPLENRGDRAIDTSDALGENSRPARRSPGFAIEILSNRLSFYLAQLLLK